MFHHSLQLKRGEEVSHRLKLTDIWARVGGRRGGFSDRSGSGDEQKYEQAKECENHCDYSKVSVPRKFNLYHADRGKLENQPYLVVFSGAG
jgi:hypothetical protein